MTCVIIIFRRGHGHGSPYGSAKQLAGRLPKQAVARSALGLLIIDHPSPSTLLHPFKISFLTIDDELCSSLFIYYI